MDFIFIKRALIVILLDVVAGAAFAQFVWVDAKGTRQYSDQPPPASIPKKNILKEPAAELRKQQNGAVSGTDNNGGNLDNGETQKETSTTAAGLSEANAAATPKAPLTTAQKNMDFNKRRNEQTEKDKKSTEEAKRLADKTKNCERAQSYAKTLQSGERISVTDRNGERTYISDEKRSQELNDAKRLLDSCK
jgi:hypothetical protein